MTEYQRGFLAKCAELGVPEGAAGSLLKMAEGSNGSNGSNGSDPSLQQAEAIFKDWLTNRRYTVRRAETLSGIAIRNKIPLKDLMEANGLKSTYVKPGQILKIPNGLGKRKGEDKDKGDGDASGVR